MTAIRLDLAIYPLRWIRRAVVAYKPIAKVSVRSAESGVAVVDLTPRGDHDEDLVVDEFLNYLIALLAVGPREV
jgi:hypothetical protein